MIVTDVLGIRRAEKEIINSFSDEIRVIERVAQATFKAIPNEFYDKRFVIVCGKGNNAADGLALSLLLGNARIVTTYTSGSSAYDYFLEKCKLKGLEITSEFDFTDDDVIIDCLTGIGFKGSPKEELDKAINQINSKNAFVISLDIPSGLDADTGFCDNAVFADMTITVQACKIGLIINKGREYSGKIVAVSCGLPVKDILGTTVEDIDVKTNIKKRSVTGAKNEYGYVGILGGCDNYSGAPSLSSAALSSLRSGAGVARAIVPKSIADTLKGFAPEITVFCADDVAEVSNAVKGLNALSVGMGWGRRKDRQDILKYLLSEFPNQLIIDADGLYALSEIGLEYLKKARKKPILTPHDGEYKRLFGCEKTLDNIKENALKYNCVILSKGATTIITDGVKVWFSLSGSNGMATAGSGDVLSGVITALTSYTDPLSAAAFGAYVNGLAGERAAMTYGEMGMLSSDTIKELAFVLKDILK